MNKKHIHILLGILFVLAVIVLLHPNKSTTPTETLPGDKQVSDGEIEIATFAGGCFWCIEAPLQETEGVRSAVSGYTGGAADTATYKQVSSGGTQHREAVQVEYYPDIVSYEELVGIFFTHIDPLDAGGQFADRGFHYTTAVYYHTEEQLAVVQEVIADINTSEKFETDIVTEVLPNAAFYPAEEYHQDYYIKASAAYKRYEKGSGRADYIEDVWE